MYTILYLFENMIIIFGTSYMACALEQNNMSLPEYIRITKNIWITNPVLRLILFNN
jgi:hypothetical protein